MLRSLFRISVIPIIFLQVSLAVFQSPAKAPPQTPSEAYERATEPLREWFKLPNQTLETNIKANEEQVRRAKEYSNLFIRDKWKGEELLNLGRLYELANQHEKAERAFTAYLREADAQKKTIARKQLLDALAAQEKWNDAIPVASLLLDESTYDQDIISSTQSLIDGLRSTNLRQAVILSEKRLPRLFTYAEASLKNPDHVAWILDRAIELGALYREAGDKTKSDQFYASFLSRFSSSPLASEKRVKIGVEAAFQRARLIDAEAPAIAGVEYIDIQKTNISDLKGKVILLDFLAHWCPPCITSFPEIDVLKKKYEASGFVVLGITSYYGFFGSREKVSPAEELAELKSLKEKRQVKFGFIVGPRDNETAYGIAGLPAYGLIDRNGRVRYLAPGRTKQQKQRIEQMIQELIQERPK
jgi:thiol-disulfide isomerase/thioredoxin